MRKFLCGLFCAAGSALLIIALLILSVDMFAVNQGFFTSEYSRLGTAGNLGMSSEELNTVTKNLLDYTIGSRDSLDMKAVINGTEREVFDQREKYHMVDVKALYLNAKSFMIYSFIGAAALFILAFIIKGWKAFRTLCRSFLGVSGVFLIIVVALGIYAALDFTNFWISFHHVFFPGNDLWQLDPNTEVLINMVPEQFFSDLVSSIIICFVSIFAALNIAAFTGNRILKKRVSLAGGEA
jgi:integral membrane protein (TIGR01906 family)